MKNVKMKDSDGKFMEYKGFIGSVEFSEADGVYFGKVQGIQSLVSYEGNNTEDLADDFRSAVDDYQMIISEECSGLETNMSNVQ